MDNLDLFKNRRSVRKYLNKPLEISKVYEILDTARYAPSSGNLQNWYFIIVNEQKEKNKLASLCLEQFWMAKAPVMIIVCVKRDICLKYYGPKLGKKYSLQNGVFASANILLAAQTIGVSSSFVGAFSESDIHKEFTVPDNVAIVGVITLGYTNEKPKTPSRYELKTITFLNKWGNKIKNYKYHALGRTSDYVEGFVKDIKNNNKDTSSKVKKFFKNLFSKNKVQDNIKTPNPNKKE